MSLSKELLELQEWWKKNQDIDVIYKAAIRCQNTVMIHCFSLVDFIFKRNS